MILDHIDSALLYGGLGERIAAGLALLTDDRVRHAAPGKYEVQGCDLYFVVMDYHTKPLTEAKPEVHHKYMDIQCVLDGTEHIGYSPLNGLILDTPYNSENDCAFYKASTSQTLLKLKEGLFAIFWPNEPHSPCICIDTPKPVRKVVIKVKME